MVPHVQVTRARLMLAAVAARLLVSVLGPAAVELDPFHTHVTVGGTPQQQAEALARHRHDHARHATPDHDHAAAASRVLSITSGSPAGVLVLGLTGAASAIAAQIKITVPERSGLIALSASPSLSSPARAVPEPPPRAA